jgi:hypothetical protein
MAGVSQSSREGTAAAFSSGIKRSLLILAAVVQEWLLAPGTKEQHFRSVMTSSGAPARFAHIRQLRYRRIRSVSSGDVLCHRGHRRRTRPCKRAKGAEVDCV